MIGLSNGALISALFLYMASFFVFVISITGKRFSNRDSETFTKKWSKYGFIVACIGLAAHLIYFFTRWYYSGRIPNSNLFEFIALLAMMITIAFIVIYIFYRSPALGVFSMPVSFIILAYATVFPWEAQPLVPSLNSHWLKIHVTTAALGEAFFAVGFAAGLMYLLRKIDFKAKDKSSRRQQRAVEFTIFVVLTLVSFIVAAYLFKGINYEAVFTHEAYELNENQETVLVEQQTVYTMPPIVKPFDSSVDAMKPFLGMKSPVFEAPEWLKGVNAARKLNTILWSFVISIILYVIFRLVLRKPLGRAISPVMDGIDEEDLDEISYRAIAIGFPIFTLGALIFAMIWAHIAWSRFWDWDPKEVWALITWLFYSAYLHLRLSRSWMGLKSAWLAVIGFVIVLFTLIGVNLIIAGLHSYAGVL